MNQCEQRIFSNLVLLVPLVVKNARGVSKYSFVNRSFSICVIKTAVETMYQRKYAQWKWFESIKNRRIENKIKTAQFYTCIELFIHEMKIK